MLKDLGLTENPDGSKGESGQEMHQNPLSSVLSFLTSLPLSSGVGEDAGAKPSCYLVEKGLCTLSLKLVEKVWRMDYIEVEEFLPAPRCL